MGLVLAIIGLMFLAVGAYRGFFKPWAWYPNNDILGLIALMFFVTSLAIANL